VRAAYISIVSPPSPRALALAPALSSRGGGGIGDERAGLGAGHERAVGAAGAIGEALAEVGQAAGGGGLEERAARRADDGERAAERLGGTVEQGGGERRGGGDVVVERAVRLDVLDSEAGDARDGVEGGALLGDRRGERGRGRVQRAAAEAVAVGVRRVRAGARPRVGGAERDDARHRRGVAGVAAARDVEEVEERPEILGLVGELAGVEVEERGHGARHGARPKCSRIAASTASGASSCG
jgi:hypothetical protein